MKYVELTEKIINAAYKIHNVLGFGFLEKVYQNALMIELKRMGLKATGIEVGLLINFGHSVEVKRKVFDKLIFICEIRGIRV